MSTELYESRGEQSPAGANLQAEQAVLGAMLISEENCGRAVEGLSSNDFFDPLHAALFNIMMQMFLHGRPVEPITVNQEALKAGLGGRLRNGVLLVDLMSGHFNSLNLSHYISLIRDAAILRRIATASTRTYQVAMAPGAEADRVAALAVEEMTKAATEHVPDTAELATVAVQEAIERADGLANGTISAKGLETGYLDLDALTLGIQPGQLVVIAGRPAVGKSIALLDICRNLAVKKDEPVLFFSLEMSRLEIGQRLLAATAEVPLKDIREGSLTENQRHAVENARKTISAAPLFIDDATGLTVADIRAKAVRQARRQTGLSLIAVDYLALIQHPNPRVENRQVAVADISRSLKILARDVAPVLVAAQLNRGPESRADKRPVLADLRESGQIEADADLAILLHREDAYDPNTPRAGEIDFVIAKHRNGPTGTVTLAYQFTRARLANIYRG